MFTAKPQTRCNKPNASQVCKPRLNCRKAPGQVWKKPWARFPVSFETTFLKRLLIRILIFPQAVLQAIYTSQGVSLLLPSPKSAWDGAAAVWGAGFSCALPLVLCRSSALGKVLSAGLSGTQLPLWTGGVSFSSSFSTWRFGLNFTPSVQIQEAHGPCGHAKPPM